MTSDNLERLIAALEPRLLPGEFSFCSIAQGRYGDHADLAPVGAFTEAEGLTLILDADVARSNDLATGGAYRMITLGVQSNLDDVGLTARVATTLARYQISANVVAAYHHDHLFVPAADAERALAALRHLQQGTTELEE